MGIDRSSYDQSAVTLAEFPEHRGYEYVDGRFPSSPGAWRPGARRRDGLAPFVVGHPPTAVGIGSRPLLRPEAIDITSSMRYAALVFRRSATELLGVFRLLDVEAMADVQGKVVSQEVAPQY